MNLSFHALVWPCVAQAHFVFLPLGHFVPAPSGSAPAAAHRRSSIQNATRPTKNSEWRNIQMTMINLRDFFYWYKVDEYIEVSDEVAA